MPHCSSKGARRFTEGIVMRERKLGRLAIAVIAAALVGCLALALPATGAAKKKKKKPTLVTTTVSTGSIALPIPDNQTFPGNDSAPAFARSPLVPRLSARATITDVNASVRLNHGFDSDVEIFLASPRGVILLSRDNGGNRDNYGSGPTSCAGVPTTFDSDAGTPITAGIAPFVGTFAPQESLAVLNGLKGAVASVPWTLEVGDDTEADAGTLYCWNLVVRYRIPPKKKGK
jgi:subtilisin-like proprotein convertase family protein